MQAQATPEMQLGQQYADEVKTMFMSGDFKESQAQQRRELVGSTIYKYVDQMIGPEVAPKITGMIIDLPPSDLNMSVLQHPSLQQKVRAALQLLVDSQTLKAPLSDKATAFLQGAGIQQQAMQQPNVTADGGLMAAPASQQVMAV